jgi:hypothetical protein
LARSIGFWAALFAPGQPVAAGDRAAGVDDVGTAVTRAAADGARHYLTRPNIFNLHGITAAMAVEILVRHLPPGAGAAGLAQVRAEHAALYRRTGPAATADAAGTGRDDLARLAAGSDDPHAVKLVEACRRGLDTTGDPVFAAAAERVVRPWARARR